MCKKLLISLFFFVPLFLFSQTNMLRGYVTDKDTGEPLIGATIINFDFGTQTELDGSYEIEILDGENLIIVSYIGYGEFPVSAIGDGTDQVLDISIAESTTILETTTITGSRYEKSLAKSPVSINVIKPQLLENTNTTIISSLLDKVPGVQIIDGQANIRGGSGYSYGAGSRVLLLIDDVPAFQSDAGRPLWDDIPVENIAQIEVLKGASSALYGSAALNGIINIRTGYALSEPVTKLSTSYTHYLSPRDARKKWWDSAPHSYNVGLTHKQKFGKLDVVAAGFLENVESYYQGTYKDRYRLSANLKYRFSERVHLALNTMYNYKDDNSYLLWENARDGAYKGWESGYVENLTKRFYIDPQLTIYDKKLNKHKLITRYYKIENGSATNQATGSNNFFVEYQFTGDYKPLDLQYTLGSSAYLAKSNSELYGSVDLNANNYAGYLQLEKAFSDKLTVTLGSRYEYNYHLSPEVFLTDTIPGGSVSESRLVSRMGLNYTLAPFTYLRASWGQGYRFPTIAERFISNNLGSFNIIPNTSLKSETGWTAELGIKQGIKIDDWEGYLDLATFRSEYSNMMEFTFGNYDGVSGFQSQNVGNTVVNGFEVNLIGRSKLFGWPTSILLGYTFIDPYYKDYDTNEGIRASVSIPSDPGADPNVLKYRTKHSFKVDVETTIAGFSIGGAINTASAMTTIDQFLSMLNEINQYRAANGGYTRVDLRASYKWKAFKFSLLGGNVFNGEYAIRPGILEAPRNVSLRLDMSLQELL